MPSTTPGMYFTAASAKLNVPLSCPYRLLLGIPKSRSKSYTELQPSSLDEIKYIYPYNCIHQNTTGMLHQRKIAAIFKQRCGAPLSKDDKILLRHACAYFFKYETTTEFGPTMIRDRFGDQAARDAEEVAAMLRHGALAAAQAENAATYADEMPAFGRVMYLAKAEFDGAPEDMTRADVDFVFPYNCIHQNTADEEFDRKFGMVRMHTMVMDGDFPDDVLEGLSEENRKAWREACRYFREHEGEADREAMAELPVERVRDVEEVAEMLRRGSPFQ